MEYFFLSTVVLLVAVVIAFVRIDALSERIDYIEQALRRVAPPDSQLGGYWMAMRIETEISTTARVHGEAYPVTVRDLSMTGAQVDGGPALTVGDHLTLCLPVGDKSTETRSKVVRILGDAKYGVHFEVPSKTFIRTVKFLRAEALKKSRARDH